MYNFLLLRDLHGLVVSSGELENLDATTAVRYL
jgi:hypothetical protein